MASKKGLTKEQAFGRSIASARMMGDFSQAELAGMASVSPSTVANVEGGQGNPRPATINALTSALRSAGISVYRDLKNKNLTVTLCYR